MGDLFRRRSEKDHWDRFWSEADSVEEVYSNDGRVVEHLSRVCDVSGKRILEVGAGTGRDSIVLSRMGATVVSLDYSIESLNLVKKGSGEADEVFLCCGNAFSLPFADETFDVVFHQGLLEHFTNPDDLLAENVRVLKPGGLLLVDVPQRFHYYTLMKHLMIFFNKWFAGWETEFSVGELEKLLRRHSLDIVLSYGEWFNPPIWYRMLRRGLIRAGIKLPMYPGIFDILGKMMGTLRNWALRRRFFLYTTVIVGTIAKKREEI